MFPSVGIFFIVLLYEFLPYCVQSVEVVACSNNNDCSEFKNSICNTTTAKCTCPRGYVISSDLTGCLLAATGYGAPCVDSIQCSAWMSAGADCSPTTGTCVCTTGYHYRDGHCFKTTKLSENCTHNENCYDGYDLEALQCQENVCTCSNNYFERDGIDCRRRSETIDEPCLLDIECQFEHAHCNNKNIPFVCKKGRRAEDAHTMVIMPPSPMEIAQLQAQAQAQGQEIAQTNVSVETTTEKINKTNILGVSCNNDNECSLVENSVCYGVCRCLHGYYPDSESDTCLPELGTTVSEASDCDHLRNSQFRDGKCLCYVGFAYSADNRECIKAARKLNDSCTKDINCHTFGSDAICSEKQCACPLVSWYDSIHVLCRISQKIGDECSTNQDCQLDETISAVSPICTRNICSCPPESHMISNNISCQPDHVDLGGRCFEKSDCRQKHADCINETCTCDVTHYPDDNNTSCKAGLDANCDSDKDCALTNTNCVNNQCQCITGFIGYNQQCYELAKQVNDTCQLDIQCKTKLNDESECLHNHCVCKPNTHEFKGRCFQTKHLGEQCTKIGECVSPTNASTVECRNNYCSCSTGYTESEDSLQCLKANGNINSFGLLLIILSILFTFATK